jgi:parallel beta-helix repeat protein
MKTAHAITPKALLIGLVLLASLALAPPPAVADQLHCGEVVTHSVTLHRDLLGCSSNGLIVGAPNITINLNRHTIAGTGGDCCSVGIVNANLFGGLPGSDGVVIKGGTVRDFTYEILASEVAHNVVRDMRVSGAEEGGIQLEVATDSIVRRNRVSGSNGAIRLIGGGQSSVEQNEVSGNCFGIHLDGSNENLVRRNRVSGNPCLGIELIDAQNNVVTSNDVFDNGDGTEGLGQAVFLIYSQHNSIERNTGYGNQLGVALYDSSFENTIRRNRLFSNSEDGIQAIDEFSVGNLIERNIANSNGDDGIDLDFPGNVLLGNVTNANGDLGIEAAEGTVDGGRNRASGNGNPAQCLNVACR